MKLINVHTLLLEEFPPACAPRYAILSHTWGPDEILYDDLRSPDRAHLSDRYGYQKVKDCCRKVRLGQGKLDYVWVDTCCIDKRSSAELSEAINSMFRYYAGAEYCLVYLHDFEKDMTPVVENLKNCRWFKRGWTLQELIAPGDVHFLSESWEFIGRRSELAAVISEITGIALNIVTDSSSMQGSSLPYQRASVAQRMSWVASRSTTREEDMAYCVLGLFDISMPILYGEGLTKAFHRLQEEIVKHSSDYSLFIHDSNDVGMRTVLADTPKCFAKYGNVVRFAPDWISEIGPFSLSSRGVRLDVPLKLTRNGAIAVLACRYRGDFRGPLGIKLERSNDRAGQYLRRATLPQVITDFVDLEKSEYKISSIYISQNIGDMEQPKDLNSETSIWMRIRTRGDKCNIVKTWPFWFWNQTYNSFSIDVNRIWDKHYNDHLAIPLKHRQLLKREAQNLRIPAIVILADSHQALGAGYGHVLVVTLRLNRLTSGSLCPDVAFDVFPLYRENGHLEDVDIERILKEIDRRRQLKGVCTWSPVDETPLKLQSWHGPMNEGIENEDNPRQLVVAINRTHLLGEDVYIVDIAREKPTLKGPEQDLSLKSVSTQSP